MNSVLGFTEFKEKMKMYLLNLADDIEEGQKTEQTIYVLLGPPGVGKSYISEKLAESFERPLINVDLGGRRDTFQIVILLSRGFIFSLTNSFSFFSGDIRVLFFFLFRWRDFFFLFFVRSRYSFLSP